MTTHLDRRRFLQTSLLGTAGLALPGNLGAAQVPAASGPGFKGLTDTVGTGRDK